MKTYMRILALILVLVLGVGFCGCAKKDSLALNAHKWQFSAVQDRSNGELLYASSADQAAYGGVYAQAITLELSCQVGKKEMVLKNKADGQNWAFMYELQSQSDTTNIYKLSTEEITAVATVSKTLYDDGSVLYALMLSFDERTLYFYAEK